mgnify:CR=1 FL=1
MPYPVALITGAAHRLGAHTAETLHARGWNVVIHYRGREQQARALADKLNQQRPASAVCYHADLADMNQLRQLAEQACAHWGQLDALVAVQNHIPTPLAHANKAFNPARQRLCCV